MIVILLPVIVYSLLHISKAEAAWIDSNWSFRKSIAISSHTSAETNVYINLTGGNALDTSATGKFKANCGDIRFTDASGNKLPYYIVSGCQTATTVIHVFMANFPAGAQTIYFYYGNPSAPDGFSKTDFTTVATSYTIGSLGSEENGVAPVAYWKFDEGTGTTVNDSSANNNDGTITAPTWQTEDKCISGKCLYFDGTSSYVQSQTNLGITGSNPITVSFWLKANTYTPGGTWAAPVSYGNIEVNDRIFEILLSTSGVIYVHTWGTTTSFGTVALNQWYYVTMTYDGSIIRAYLNGVQGNTRSVTLNLNNSPLRVGRAFTTQNSGRYFNGTIDDVKVYGYTRSAAQVQADFNSRGSQNAGANVLGASDVNENLSNGLVGYWKMDEASWNGTAGEVKDASGSLNNGTSTTASITTGKYGNGGNFNAASARVNMSNSTSLGVTTTGSISTWVNFAALTSGKFGSIFMKGSDSNNCFIEFSYQNTGSANTIRTDTGNCTNYGTVTWDGTATLATGVWYNMVTTWDGSTINIYLNGSLVKSGAQVYQVNTSTYGPIIGNDDYAYTTRYFPGSIDETRFYNRTLSPREVEQLYNWAPGPVGYYNFEEGQGTTVNDTSGYGNIGTWSGTGTGHWTQGKYGDAGNFNGADDIVNLATNPINAATIFTVSAWIYKTNTTSEDIFSNRNYPISGQVVGIALDYANNAGNGMNNQSLAVANGNTLGAQNSIWTTPTNSILQNTWYHVVLVWQNGSTPLIYINGVSQTLTPWTLGTSTTINWGPSNVAPGIGKDSQAYAGAPPFAGKIDEVKIYNYARNSAQVVSDMNAGHPNVGSPIGSAVAYWKFDEGYGLTANNSGNGGATLNGTLFNTTWTNNGKFGKALSFNGTNSYVRNTANLIPSGNFTYTAWFKTTSPATSQGIFSLRGMESVGTYIGTRIVGSKLVTYIDGSTVLTGNTTLLANTWYFLSVTYDANRSPQTIVYLNTVQDATGTTAAVYTYDQTLIGARTTATMPFNGTIDEVKVYSYALSPSDVKLEYNHGSAMVLGAMSDTSNLTGGAIASNSASAAYCIPGDTSTCNSPVGYYNFEEGQGSTVNDTSGNGNTGTWVGTGNHWTQGMVGKAGSFNGSNDNVDLGNPIPLQITSNITVSAWVKPTTIGGSKYLPIVGKRESSGGGAGYEVYLPNDNSGHLSYFNGTEFKSAYALPVNTWTYVTATVNSGTLTLYANGIPVYNNTGATPTSAGGNVYIGSALLSEATYKFPGSIDAVTIFNYARTPAQVAWDYNRGAPVAYWKLDECQGTVAHDSSGNGNNGTITIGATAPQTTVGTCLTAGTAWGNGAAGKFNASLSFDGVDDGVDVGSMSSINNGISALTVSAWVKPTTLANLKAVVYRDDPAAGVGGWAMGTTISSSTDVIVAVTGSTYGESTNHPFQNGVWGLWTMVYDGTQTGNANRMKFYFNGVQQALSFTGTIPATSVTSPVNVTIGKRSDNSRWFNGLIDDARVYNYALTKDQIQQVYNLGAAVRFGPNAGQP